MLLLYINEITSSIGYLAAEVSLYFVSYLLFRINGTLLPQPPAADNPRRRIDGSYCGTPTVTAIVEYIRNNSK